MELNGYRVGFALTGSFCTLATVIPHIETLVQKGAIVTPILSEMVYATDTRFGTASEFIHIVESICNCKAIHTIDQAEPIGPKHTLDALVVAPCTGNTLAKMANGITDACVPMAVKATLRNKRPIVVAISTNDGLSNSAKNLGTLLASTRFFFVPFGQDDPKNKATSLVARMDLIVPTLEHALDGIQIQPILN